MHLLHREMENYEDFFTANQGCHILLQSSHEQATKQLFSTLATHWSHLGPLES